MRCLVGTYFWWEGVDDYNDLGEEEEREEKEDGNDNDTMVMMREEISSEC